ncbi:MAG: Rieske 2Fe-2S domain-containing protein [Chitinophagaceae bacterium]|nr:Rieske 2Fe-2S domain-containing protein [Chitinophagaceae bacterium]
MADKKYNWIKIASSIDELHFEANGMCLMDVDGKKITLAKHNGALFAFAHKCPHASGIMADGFIDAAANVACPVHRYKFNMQTGRNTTGEGYYLKTYLVEQRADGIYTGFEERGLFSFLD